MFWGNLMVKMFNFKICETEGTPWTPTHELCDFSSPTREDCFLEALRIESQTAELHLKQFPAHIWDPCSLL